MSIHSHGIHKAHFALTLKTDSIDELMTTAEAKLHLRVDIDDDDDLIDALIIAARQYSERFMGRSLITKTWQLFLDHFPSLFDGVILLPNPPAIAVTSIKYQDGSNVQQTLATTEFQVDVQSDPARITPELSKSFPTTRIQLNAVVVEWTAGYGPASTDVPSAIIAANKLLLGHWYENREQVVLQGTPKELPRAVSSLLWAYKVKEFF